jgi:hypothetical protein
MSCFKSQAFKVFSLGGLGVAVMMAIALSLAFTLGAPKPMSTVPYSSIEDPSMTVESSAAPCNTPELGACGTVLTYGTDEQTLDFTATVPGGNSSDAASVTFQICYTQPFIAGRPWRKTSDVIGQDKQCGVMACKDVPIEGTTASCTYTVGDMLGEAVYYFRALASDSKGVYVMGNTNQDEMFQIDLYEGRTTGIIVGVIVMSVVAWVILIGGLIYEKMKKE